MKICLVCYSNYQLEYLKEFIRSCLPNLSQEILYSESIIDVGQNTSISKLMNNSELAIIPIASLEYPFPNSYKVISLIDTNISASNIRTSEKQLYTVVSHHGFSEDITEFGRVDIRKTYGKVYITGFGPGDPDLLTLKAVKAIESADVIFYDSLINQEFLEQYDKEKVFVGKRKGNHSHSQDKIDEMLYQSAISGKNTVRLKGGDPFIYGRGGEELDYLRKRFVEVEIIPGITAAFGAAASTGISLTQREVSSSVAFCTGFPKENRRIPDADTLVFYMSASNLKETAKLLIKNGRSHKTPVALVRNATHKNEESSFGTIKDLIDGKLSLPSPVVVIVGNVAIRKDIDLF